MCLCSYHENFISAVDALHTYVPTLPDYKDGFVPHFLCKETSADCWFMKEKVDSPTKDGEVLTKDGENADRRCRKCRPIFGPIFLVHWG